MNYTDNYFEKNGYDKTVENERIVSYEKKEENHSTIVILINESPNGPAYFHFSVEKYVQMRDGQISGARIKDIEYEMLKNKAQELMKKIIEPTIRSENKHIHEHIPMTCGFSETGPKKHKR